MKSSIFITTTESIEGMKIEKYFDLISTNVVVGTNLFSDIGASFTDVFGGMSDTYQNKLEKINKVALDKLKTKAQGLGANGIIGVKIDFDEISGKSKSMLMISAIGMAVKLKTIEGKIPASQIEVNQIANSEDLEIAVKKIILENKIKKGDQLTNEDWDTLLDNPDSSSINLIFEKYLNLFKISLSAVSDEQKLWRNYFPQYLRLINEDIVSELLYSKIKEDAIVVTTLIFESKSFSPKRTLNLFQNNEIHLAIGTLKALKNYYNKEDLEVMKEIRNSIENLPNTGKIEPVRSLLGSTKEKFICEQNHQNDSNIEFCLECKLNIKGLISSEVQQIQGFLFTVEALESLIEK